MKLYNIVKLSDAHVPFEDPVAVQAAIKFCKQLQPDIIVTDEWMDFYSLSRFLKRPDLMGGYTLNNARTTVQKYFVQIKKVCPNSRRVHLKSNHALRLPKYLMSKAPELYDLPELSIETFMGYNKLDIEHMDYFTVRDVFLFKHGDIIRKHSGYTARWEFDTEGMSGMSGHSHRRSQYDVTKRGGEYTWVENGCLCRTDMEYLEGKIPNWQQGIGLVQFKGNTKQFAAHCLPIVNGEIIWGF